MLLLETLLLHGSSQGWREGFRSLLSDGLVSLVALLAAGTSQCFGCEDIKIYV
jgi:hypothetical protein